MSQTERCSSLTNDCRRELEEARAHAAFLAARLEELAVETRALARAAMIAFQGRDAGVHECAVQMQDTIEQRLFRLAEFVRADPKCAEDAEAALKLDGLIGLYRAEALGRPPVKREPPVELF